jgi:hypothetical protein
MHRIFAVLAALLALTGPAFTQAARADDRSVDFTVSLVTTNYAPGQLFADGIGNQYFQGATFSGQASGWPFNGTFRLDADISFDAGTGRGDLDGSFVLTDASGSTVHGNIEDGTIANIGNGQTAIDARVRFDGGTGFLDGASGRARLTGAVPLVSQPLAGGAAFGQPPVLYSPTGQPQFGQPQLTQFNGVAGPTMSLSGSISLNDASRLPNQSAYGNPYGNGFGVAPSDNVRPGNGYGDRNHIHTGPPGQNRDDNRGNSNGNGHGRGRGRD